MSVNNFKDVLNKFMPDDNSISLLADYLGYEIGKNPLDPNGEWKIFFSKRVTNKNNGVIAIRPEKELNENTSTIVSYQHYLDSNLDVYLDWLPLF